VTVPERNGSIDKISTTPVQSQVFNIKRVHMKLRHSCKKGVPMYCNFKTVDQEKVDQRKDLK
jgi:hypothetical protein